MAQAASAPKLRPDPPSHHQDSLVRREPGGTWQPTPRRIMWPRLLRGFGGRRLSRLDPLLFGDRWIAVRSGLSRDTGLLPRARLRLFGSRVDPSIQYGLDGEAHGYISRAVENLKNLVADQTTEFAPGPLFGNEFDPAVAGVAVCAV